MSVPYARTVNDLIEVVRLAERRRVQPDVLRIGFDTLDKIYALVARGRLQGRAVLTPRAD